MPHFHLKKLRWNREYKISSKNTIIIWDECNVCKLKRDVAVVQCQNDPGWVMVG